MSTKDIRIQQKVDSLANWVKNNPILLKNEIGYEEETGKFKIGDGNTPWIDLKTEENSKGFKIINVSNTKALPPSKPYKEYYYIECKCPEALKASIVEEDKLWVKTSKVFVLTVAAEPSYTENTFPNEGLGTLRVFVFEEDISDLIPLETDADDLENGVIENYFTVIGKPELGAITVNYFACVEGENSIAQGRAAHAEGRLTNAFGNYSHAEGLRTKANIGAHAEGMDTQALGDQSHASGYQSIAEGAYSQASGYKVKTTANCATAIGIGTVAADEYGIALGQYSTDEMTETWVKIGNGTNDIDRKDLLRVQKDGKIEVLNSKSGISIGNGNTYFGKSGKDTIVIGTSNEGDDTAPIILGRGIHANSKKGVYIGNNQSTGGDGVVSIGNDTVTMGVSIGPGAKSHTADTIAIGNGAQAGGSNEGSIAVGKSANADAAAAIAVGEESAAKAYSTAIGHDAKATEQNSTALGYGSTASGNTSTAVGNSAKATAKDSVQLGAGTNSTANSLQFKDYQVIDTNGKMPDDRLNDTVVKEEHLYPIVEYFDQVTLVGGDNADAIILGSQAKDYRDQKKIAGSGTIIIGPEAGYANDDIGYGGSIAIGQKAQIESPSGIAIGTNSYNYSNGVSIGKNTRTANTYANALGDDSKATGWGSVAIGCSTEAHYEYYSGWYLGEEVEYRAPIGGVAIGHGGKTNGGVAIGGSSYSQSGVAIGPTARTLPRESYDDNVSHGIAIGEEAVVNGSGIAIGQNSEVSQSTYSPTEVLFGETVHKGMAIGNNAKAGEYGLAIGPYTLSNQGLALGRRVTATTDSICIGSDIDLVGHDGGENVINIGQSGTTCAPASNSISLGSKFIDHTTEENNWYTPENTFAVWKYPMLNRLTGKIPEERLPSRLQSYYCNYNSQTIYDNFIFDEKILLYTLPEATNYLLIEPLGQGVYSCIIKKDETKLLFGEENNATYYGELFFDGFNLYGVYDASANRHGINSILKLTPLQGYTPPTNNMDDEINWDMALPTLTFTAPSDISQCNKSNCLFYAEESSKFIFLSEMNFVDGVTFNDNSSFRIIGTDDNGTIIINTVVDTTSDSLNIKNRRIFNILLGGASSYPTRLYIFSNVSSTEIQYQNLFNEFYPTYSRLYYSTSSSSSTSGFGFITAETGSSSGSYVRNQLEKYKNI